MTWLHPHIIKMDDSDFPHNCTRGLIGWRCLTMCPPGLLGSRQCPDPPQQCWVSSISFTSLVGTELYMLRWKCTAVAAFQALPQFYSVDLFALQGIGDGNPCHHRARH